MLYFILVWVPLFVLCLLTGLGLLNWLNIPHFSRWGDRFILATWFGLLAFCISLMAVSLKMALSMGVALFIAFFWLAVSLINEKTRKEIKQFYAFISLKVIVFGFGLAIAIAFLTTQQVIWFDSGLYHLSSIHWFAKFGAVQGIALIESKLGFTSSWFAFHAPFTFNFPDNVGGIANGFALFVMACHCLIAWHYFLHPQRKLSDGFIALFFSALILIYVVENLTGSPIIISFSPDIPIAILIGITAWAILGQFSDQKPLIILALAAGTFTIKMSALPLLAVGILYYIVEQHFNLKALLFGSLLTLALLLPNLAVASTTSGCPLYPSQVMCWDLPWTITEDTSQRELNTITGINQNPEPESEQSPEQESNQNPLKPLFDLLQGRYEWLKQDRKIQFTFFLFVINLVVSGVLLRLKNQGQEHDIRWLIFLGLVSSLFVLITIPLLRFGIGYFLIIMVLGLTIFGQSILEKYEALLTPSVTRWLYISLVTGLIFSLGIGHQQNWTNRLLLPENVPSLPLNTETINNVTYRYPKDWQLQCWMAELPCSSLPIDKNIELRQPKQGLKSGFQLKS